MNVEVEDIIKEGAENIECPLCKGKDFEANNCITSKFPIDNNNSPCNGNVVPVIEYTCIKCGNVISLNADILVQKLINK